MNSLPRIRTGLLKHPLEQQVLVYDPHAQQVHLLDPTTGFVLELLEKGGYTPEGLAYEVAERTGVADQSALIALAVEELRKAHLLDETSEALSPLAEVSRREAVRKLALTGAAAALLPGIATLIPTRTYAQGTAAAGGAAGTACSANTQCSSSNCCGAPSGICSNTGCPQPNGQLCNAPGQCVSGSCQAGVCTALAACAACTSGPQCVGGTCNNLGACTATANRRATGVACSSGPAPSCETQETNANLQCCSGVCAGSCSGSGSSRTWSGTCT